MNTTQVITIAAASVALAVVAFGLLRRRRMPEGRKRAMRGRR
ncbi:MAG: hypothetical protein ABI977_02105 [Acidobacteriota bacterium]